jgi:hypothetical protein
MKGRKIGATVVVAALAAIGLTLPGTAAARSNYTPPLCVQNTSMIVDVQAAMNASTATVSWSDAYEAVSWGD